MKNYIYSIPLLSGLSFVDIYLLVDVNFYLLPDNREYNNLYEIKLYIYFWSLFCKLILFPSFIIFQLVFSKNYYADDSIRS